MYPQPLLTKTLVTFFYILVDVWKRGTEGGGEMICNKEAVYGAHFGFFYSVHKRGKKKDIYSSVMPALCHFDGNVGVSLRVQYLHPH